MEEITELVFLLDRSGSMEHLTTETIGGFNSLIKHEKEKQIGLVYVTTVLFDGRYELLHNHININDVPLLTEEEYYARGCTALLDAIGRTIDSLDTIMEAYIKNRTPAKVLFVITTDGYENASRQYTKRQIRKSISLHQELSHWKFLFLGADIDAIGEASSLGIKRSGAYKIPATAKGIFGSFDALQKIADYLFSIPGIYLQDEEYDEYFDDECSHAFSELE